MKRTVLILFILFPGIIFAQNDDLDLVLEKTCVCFKDIVKNTATKFEFDQSFGTCIDYLSENLIQIDSTYSDVKKMNKLIHKELKSSCKHFKKVDDLYNQYNSQKENNFKVKTSDCALLKSGIFIGLGDKDSSLIYMTDTLQTIKFKSGSYTKSKVEWVDPCSYKIIRIESTDPYESQMVKPGEERMIRIIGVENETIFTYELEVNGKFYQGKLVKQ